MDIQYLPISWPTYLDLAQKLAATLLSHEERIDKIVGIARGGLTLGHILSDLLNVPVATFTIQSYTDIQEQGEMKITEPLRSPIAGKNILLVDDVADSGKTLKRAVTYLKRFRPKKVTVVTMLYKPKSTFRPDYFALETKKWILFPYSWTEHMTDIIHGLEKDGKSKAEIQKFLNKLGYTVEQIKFVRKYHL